MVIETLRPGCQIIHADCLSVIDRLEFDAIISDPPYGIDFRKGSENRTGQNKGIAFSTKRIIGDSTPFDPAPLLKACKGSDSKLNPLGRKPLAMFGANHYASRLPDGGTWLCWDKACGQGPASNFVDGEFIWANRIIKRNLYHQLWLGCIRTGQDNPNNSKRLHVSQKPVELMSWLLAQCRVGLGKTVLDPYMGSGSTGVACLQSGRRFIGVEIDAESYASAKARLQREIETQSTEQLSFPQEEECYPAS